MHCWDITLQARVPQLICLLVVYNKHMVQPVCCYFWYSCSIYFQLLAIQGLSIDDEMDTIRQTMGVCLQEDLIFDKLTAREHLELFAVLKGVPAASQASEIEHALKQVDLYDDKDRYAAEFSGGMKRKLSFAISMLGDSSIIILDERMCKKCFY